MQDGSYGPSSPTADARNRLFTAPSQYSEYSAANAMMRCMDTAKTKWSPGFSGLGMNEMCVPPLSAHDRSAQDRPLKHQQFRQRLPSTDR